MGYIFKSNSRDRMPTHFGPALGPRYNPEKTFAGTAYATTAEVMAIFEANADRLEEFLPPGFELRSPYSLRFEFSYLAGVSFLTGRAYNTFGAFVPVTFRGCEDVVAGDLLLVLWKNFADAIITGRDELGFSKVYCELLERRRVGDRIKCRAVWDGFEFAVMELTGLNDGCLEALPADPESTGILHYKYINATGTIGEANVEYAIFTPQNPNFATINKLMLAETAEVNFRKSTWEELPTLQHIVHAIEKLNIGKCLGAAYIEARGGGDLSNQRRLSQKSHSSLSFVMFKAGYSYAAWFQDGMNTWVH